MLDTLRAPPQQGSLRESVLILLKMKLEAIEHARFRALAQIIIDKEKGIEAFEEYMKTAFPYLAAAKKQERKQSIQQLLGEVGRGAMMIRAMPQPQLKSRVSSARISRAKAQSPGEEQQLYRRIGRTL